MSAAFARREMSGAALRLHRGRRGRWRWDRLFLRLRRQNRRRVALQLAGEIGRLVGDYPLEGQELAAKLRIRFRARLLDDLIDKVLRDRVSVGPDVADH